MAMLKVAVALSFLQAFAVLAVDLGQPIVGCSEVDCPTANNTTSAECRVADRTLSLIGLSTFNTAVADDDFTWTEGIQAYDNLDPNVDDDRVYERNFYLGSPQGFDLVENSTASGFGACALFFTTVSESVTFGGDKNETSVGTCNDALSSDCVNALLKQATDVASKFSASESCKKLQSDFESNLVPECSRVATGDKWEGLKVQDLTGSAAPKPLTDAENSTSNCYPTLPKSNSLTRVASFNTTGTALVESVVENLYGITPILTLFFPRNEPKSGSGSAVLKKPEAQLTCLKGVGLTDAEIATKSSTDANKDSAADMLTSPKLVMLGWALMLSFWVFI